MQGFFSNLKKSINSLDAGVISCEFMKYQDDIRSILVPVRPPNVPPKYIESISYFFFLVRFVKHQMNLKLIEGCVDFMDSMFVDNESSRIVNNESDLVGYNAFRRDLYDKMYQSGLHTNSPNLDLSLILLQMYLNSSLDNKYLYAFLEKRDKIHQQIDMFVVELQEKDPESFQGDASWDQVLLLFDRPDT